MSARIDSSLTIDQLRQISDSVGERRGWDFSRVRSEHAPVPWDYADVVRKFLTQSDHVLDIGTGGGEIFFALAPSFRRGIGIDSSVEMINQALQNRAAQRIANVDLAVMDGHNLSFPDAQFDAVLNRHATVTVSETARVLRTNAYFLTQQVARRNTLNLLEAFGWTPATFGDDWWQPMEELAADFVQAGCQVVARAEYDVSYWFCDVESLVFWLKAAPLPEPFDVEKHWHFVNRILKEYVTPGGIETNEHRELLIVQKA